MRHKDFTYSERIRVYAEGKLAFKEGVLRGDNPYTANKDLAGLWRHGWEIAEEASNGKTLPIEGKL